MKSVQNVTLSTKIRNTLTPTQTVRYMNSDRRKNPSFTFRALYIPTIMRKMNPNEITLELYLSRLIPAHGSISSSAADVFAVHDAHSKINDIPDSTPETAQWKSTDSL
eukprot:153986_1